METWLETFAHSHGGALDHNRSTSWRGTTELSFNRYILHIPVIHHSLQVELLYREAYGRLRSHYQIKGQMHFTTNSQGSLSVTKRTWWHRLYRHVYTTGITAFDNYYVIRGDKKLAEAVFKGEPIIHYMIQASLIGFYLKPAKNKKTLMECFGVYNKPPREPLQAIVSVCQAISQIEGRL